MISRAVGSGKRRETQERNEKKQKKSFFTLDITQSRIELVRAPNARPTRIERGFDPTGSFSGLRHLKPSYLRLLTPSALQMTHRVYFEEYTGVPS
jgi:hypothetical protein